MDKIRSDQLFEVAGFLHEIGAVDDDSFFVEIFNQAEENFNTVGEVHFIMAETLRNMCITILISQGLYKKSEGK